MDDDGDDDVNSAQVHAQVHAQVSEQLPSNNINATGAASSAESMVMDQSPSGDSGLNTRADQIGPPIQQSVDNKPMYARAKSIHEACMSWKSFLTVHYGACPESRVVQGVASDCWLSTTTNTTYPESWVVLSVVTDCSLSHATVWVSIRFEVRLSS